MGFVVVAIDRITAINVKSFNYFNSIKIIVLKEKIDSLFMPHGSVAMCLSGIPM